MSGALGRPDAAAVWDVVARVDAGDLETAAALLRALHAADQADVLAALSTRPGDTLCHLIRHVDLPGTAGPGS